MTLQTQASLTHGEALNARVLERSLPNLHLKFQVLLMFLQLL